MKNNSMSLLFSSLKNLLLSFDNGKHKLGRFFRDSINGCIIEDKNEDQVKRDQQE